MKHARESRKLAMVAMLATLVLAPFEARATAPALVCEKVVGKSLVACVNKVVRQQGKCYLSSGAACAENDAKIAKALDGVARKIAKRCGSDSLVQTVSYGPSMTVASLVSRIQSSCRAEASALASRTFGGPHGAALASADEAEWDCLEAVLREGRKLLVGRAKAQNTCVDKQHKSGNCDTTKTDEKIAALETDTSAAIAEACGAPDPLASLIALNTPQYLSRAGTQSRCMTAIAHPDPSPLELDCGPRDGLDATPRGQYVQIVLDEAEWGTRCGDGSPFAFWIRLAPAGEPVENVVLQMQGGGVCIFESDCASRSADLFEAQSDGAEQSGIMSNDPLVSPFANWTKVYLPYCNQDVFIGGGATSNFPSITVHRFGAVNVRAALRYLRDVLWREMDATDSQGYRPDRIRMLFGGTSAGGFGTLYNYHYVLDDLQWAHTAAWPDAALALDNGQPLGIAALGILLTTDIPPLGWGSLAQLPPYCFASNCGVGPVIYAASAPRLKAVPEQQFLVLSNQVDNTQVSTTFFSNLPTWINTMRQSYCDTAGTNGLRYFLPAITASTHVIATRQNLFTGQSVDGILMRDWLDLAMTDGDNLFDAVEEGTLVTDYAGVNAFPCAID
jgi:hypothetical protein